MTGNKRFETDKGFNDFLMSILIISMTINNLKISLRG